ncbi:MAG: sensor histidine kinase, partial [Treponema sp.]|nr:sensor histidine kinase [Treponema sp.]
MAQKQNAVLAFLSSNKFDDPRDITVLDEMIRYVIFNIALFIGSAFLIIFGLTVIQEGNILRGFFDLLLGLMCVLTIFTLRTKAPFVVVAFVPITAFAALCAMLVLSGGERGFAGLWIYSFPLIGIFILGLHIGSILSGLLLAAIMIGTIIPGLAGFDYVLPVAFRLIAVYVL